jgi:hypothetical protein
VLDRQRRQGGLTLATVRVLTGTATGNDFFLVTPPGGTALSIVGEITGWTVALNQNTFRGTFNLVFRDTGATFATVAVSRLKLTRGYDY